MSTYIQVLQKHDLSSNLETENTVHWSVIVQELAQPGVAVTRGELLLLALALGQLSLVDQGDVVSVGAELGGDDTILTNLVVPGVGEYLCILVTAVSL